MDTPRRSGKCSQRRTDGFTRGIRIGKNLSCKLWSIDGIKKAGEGARPTLFSVEWEMFVTAEQKVLQAVAMQLMNGDLGTLGEDGQKLRVKRVGSGRLRMVQFKLNGRVFEAIEQNREKAEPMGKTGTGEASGGAIPGCGDA
jgi:hypothetical protein